MAIDGALQSQLMGWFNSLDETTRDIFETLWRRSAGVLADVLGNGKWELSDEQGTLAEVLGAENYARSSGLGMVFNGIQTTPDPALAGGDVEATIVLIAPEGGQVGFSGTVTWTGPVNGSAALAGDAMAPRGEAYLPFTIPNAPAGSYRIDIDANPDGAEPGSPPNANGLQLKETWTIDVLDEAGAADQQGKQALNFGVGSLASMISPANWEVMKDGILEGLNWLVGAPDAALAAAVGTIYGPLSELGQNGVAGAVADAMTAVGAAAQQVDWPFEGLPDVSAVTTALNDLAAALAAAGEAETPEGEGEEQ